LLKYPEVAKRNCELCKKFLFDEETGEIKFGRDGKVELRSYYDFQGNATCPPMCQTRKGCPKGIPENQRSLNARNQLCYEFYLECKAVGQFPDEPVVRRNASIIREVEDEFDRGERVTQRQLQNAVLQMAAIR